MDDRFSKNLKFHQCYVEEQAKMRDSFMYDSFKILKSLVKKLANFVAYIQKAQPKNLNGKDFIQEVFNCNRNELI